MAPTVQETKQELMELIQIFHKDWLTVDIPPDDITPNEARVLMFIGMCAAHGKNVRPGQIAEHMRITPSAVSQTLRSLEKKDLIKRYRTDGNFRTITLVLTESGEALAESTCARYDRYMDETLAYLGSEDAEHLVRILKKIIAFHASSGCKEESDSKTNNHEGGVPCA